MFIYSPLSWWFPISFIFLNTPPPPHPLLLHEVCVTSIKRLFGRAIYLRRQAVRQISDKIACLKLIFTKRKAAVQCSHDCLAFTRGYASRCACKVVKLSQVRPPTVVWTLWTVVRFVPFLRQPCNEAQVYCTVIARQSCGICGQNMWVLALSLVVGTSCVSYNRLACLAAIVRLHTIARESQGKRTCWKFSFCCCGSGATLFLQWSFAVLRITPQVCCTKPRN